MGSTTFFPVAKKLLATFIVAIVWLSTNAQHEELKQSINAFATAKSEQYEKKYLNEKAPEYGELQTTNHDFFDFFVLKGSLRTTYRWTPSCPPFPWLLSVPS